MSVKKYLSKCDLFYVLLGFFPKIKFYEHAHLLFFSTLFSSTIMKEDIM